MKQRAAKCADDSPSSTVFNLSSKKRKNGKIILEAQSYLKVEERDPDMGISSTAFFHHGPTHHWLFVEVQV